MSPDELSAKEACYRIRGRHVRVRCGRSPQLLCLTGFFVVSVLFRMVESARGVGLTF